MTEPTIEPATDTTANTKHCFDCGASFPAGANFCGECGRRVGSKKASASAPRAKPRKREDDWDKDRARGEYKEAISRNLTRHNEESRDARLWRRIIYVAGFGGIAAWFIFKEPLDPMVAMFLGAGVFLLAMMVTAGFGLTKPDWLTRIQYSRLHGAVTEDGKTRCVNCGKVGNPWRRTVYQTNIVEARCPRCDTKLWWEAS